MTKERFDSKWIPEPNTGCWIWIACSLPCGYGTFRLNRKMLRAHRASWIIRKGEIPVGVDVLHRCDTPLCVNPDHLFLGNDQDNKNDSVAKNRHSKGERQGLAKLTDEKVRQIRSSNDTSKMVIGNIENPNGDFRTYVCRYFHNNSWWSLDLIASDDSDAESRVSKLGRLQLLGQKMAEIPVFPAAGFLIKATCWIINKFYGRRN